MWIHFSIWTLMTMSEKNVFVCFTREYWTCNFVKLDSIGKKQLHAEEI